MRNLQRISKVVIMGAVILGAAVRVGAQSAPSSSTTDETISPWYLSIGGGYIRYEGDEATKNGGFGLLRLGYDYSPRWTLRGEVSYFPDLKANTVYNDENGEPVPRPGLDGDSTWAAGLAGDVLFHLNPAADRYWDPYLVGGIGLLHYEKMRTWRSQTDVPVRAGIGLAYNFTPAWSVNAELMEHMTIDKQEFNFISSVGISWRPTVRKMVRSSSLAIVEAVNRTAVPAAVPMSGNRAAVKPTPVESVPPVPAPVPPEQAPADLRMFKLDVSSSEGKWHEYFSELDAIAKIIQSYPDAEILIEGYVDKQPNVSERDAQKLTEKKAETIRDYFVKNHNIARKRITAVGHGYSSQKAANAPAIGNPDNQRMEIHIRAARSTP